jgi:ApeA-like protein
MQQLIGKRLNGECWAPDRPEIIYKGTLQIEENHEGKLTLRGTELHLSSLPSGPGPRCFFGCLTAHYTYDVTLFRARMERGPGQSIPPDPDREAEAVFTTSNILVGGHVPSEDEAFVQGALLNLTGLEEWCNATGFSGTIKRPILADFAVETINVSFQAGASPYYDVGDGQRLRFLSQYKGPYSFEDRKHVTLEERNTIELSFPEGLRSSN